MKSFADRALSHDDDLDARVARLRQRLLDGIEHTLDELALPVIIPDPVPPHVAYLACQQALCRRAKRCRRTPCVVLMSGDDAQQR